MTRKKRVLILDDEPIVGERLKEGLERSGFIVEAYSSSRDALRKLEEEAYDILVTDLKMSSPDGMAVLRRVREMQPGIQSVVITGFATLETAAEARRSGAVEFVAKPFKMRELMNLLIALAGSRDDEAT